MAVDWEAFRDAMQITAAGITHSRCTKMIKQALENSKIKRVDGDNDSYPGGMTTSLRRENSAI